jgi:hypothetical protein
MDSQRSPLLTVLAIGAALAWAAAYAAAKHLFGW